VMPEAEIRQWIDALMPSPAQLLLQDALALEETDPRAAEAKYREALQLEPDADPIRTRIAKVLLLQNRLDECRAILDELKKKNVELDPESARIESELDVRQSALETGGVEQARLAAEADPNNVGVQILYADALAAAQQHRKALELLLGMVQRDKLGAGVDAKATMLKIFDMLGPTSDLTSEFRRKLSTALY
jgi:putative thioredoxin